MAATLGYDGVEVMVWTDAVSQDAGALQGLSDALRRAGALGARALPAGHPAGVEPGPVGAAAPGRRAGRDAGRADRRGAPAVHLAARLRPDLRRRAGRAVAAEFPDVRVRGGEHVSRCGWPAGSSSRTRRAGTRPRPGYRRVHAGPVALRGARTATRWRWPTDGRRRWRHVHLGDGTGEGRDEHLVPGPRHPALRRAAVVAGRPGLHRLGGGRGGAPAGREEPRRCARPTCAESLAFARQHLAAPSPVDA